MPYVELLTVEFTVIKYNEVECLVERLQRLHFTSMHTTKSWPYGVESVDFCNKDVSYFHNVERDWFKSHGLKI